MQPARSGSSRGRTSPRVQPGQDDLHPGEAFLGVDVPRHPAPVVGDAERTVTVQGDVDAPREPRERLVDAVVHHFAREVVGGRRVGVIPAASAPPPGRPAPRSPSRRKSGSWRHRTDFLLSDSQYWTTPVLTVTNFFVFPARSLHRPLLFSPSSRFGRSRSSAVSVGRHVALPLVDLNLVTRTYLSMTRLTKASRPILSRFGRCPPVPARAPSMTKGPQPAEPLELAPAPRSSSCFLRGSPRHGSVVCPSRTGGFIQAHPVTAFIPASDWLSEAGRRALRHSRGRPGVGSPRGRPLAVQGATGTGMTAQSLSRPSG